MGRDEMGKGRRREKRDKGAWTSTFFNVIKLIFFSFLLRRLVLLECGKKLLDCSDSGKRILVTQVPKIDSTFKLPSNDNKKRKKKEN